MLKPAMWRAEEMIQPESVLSRLDSVLLLDQIGDLNNWASVSIIQAVAESSQRHQRHETLRLLKTEIYI